MHDLDRQVEAAEVRADEADKDDSAGDDTQQILLKNSLTDLFSRIDNSPHRSYFVPSRNGCKRAP
jgi:hypothetical protein